MLGQNRFTKQDYKRHILFWSIIITLLNIIDPINTTNFKDYIIIDFLIQFKNIIVFYFLGMFVFLKYLNKNLPVFILLFLFTFIIYVSIDYVNFYHVHIKLGIKSTISDRPLRPFLFEELLFYGIIALCSFSFYRHRLSIYKLKEQSKKEKEILIKELFLVKNHLNSNLTCNFLNYCQDGLLTYSKKAASAVAVYSEMMQYNRNTNSNEKVKLNSEVSYIKNFIDLQKLLSSKVFITFNHDNEYHNIIIFPRILICFIENAFKHGICNDPESPVEIMLNNKNNRLSFTVINKIKQNKSIAGSGVGLKNARQLLQLHYQDKHNLELAETNGQYRCNLYLNLS